MWGKVLCVLLGLAVGFYLLDDFDPDSLEGKRVLVTGASTGIGEQIAYHYASFGAKVTVTARREAALQRVVAKCREVGRADGSYNYIVADMSDLNATQRVIQEAVKKMGGLDVLVLNHIIVIPLGEWKGTAGNLTMLGRIMDVNFHAYVHLTSHALPHLNQSQGSVVVVSSLAGKVAIPFVAGYSASKFALDGFYSALRQELVMQGCDISVTICVIGLVGTENAVSKLMEFGQNFLLSVLQPALPSDTALAIVKGGARRAREIYYPPSTRLGVMFRDWCPSLCDFAIRYISTPEHY